MVLDGWNKCLIWIAPPSPKNSNMLIIWVKLCDCSQITGLDFAGPFFIETKRVLTKDTESKT